VIPALAVMIGAYIVTRCVDIVTRHMKLPSGLVTVIALATIGLTLLCVIYILQQGADVAAAVQAPRF
jgi:hypothetical protein